MAKSKKLSEKIQTQNYIASFNLHEISRKCKPLRTESRLVFAWDKEKD